MVVHVSATTHYVDLNSTNPVSPYMSWATAATNIQDAVKTASTFDTVLVTNGIYETGGAVFSSMSNRVYVTTGIILKSVNGPSVTFIKGHWDPNTNGPTAVRCVYLQNSATLSGFTLTNGAVYGGVNGGGVYCESTTATVTNCIITGNTAYYLYGGAAGGGAYSGTLLNCVISNNTARNGGGVSSSTLVNCRVIGNSTGGPIGSAIGNGGGVVRCNLTNCIVANNWAGYEGGGAISSTLVGCIVSDNYCGDYGAGGTFSGTLINCTVVNNSGGGCGGVYGSVVENSIVYYNTNRNSGFPTNGTGKFTNCCIIPLPSSVPLPSSGWNNFTNPPLFEDLADEDFHLQSNSPCINAGNNSYLTNVFTHASVKTDLDGNPRISGGTVDIGAYEFQNPASIISYAWLQQFGLTNNGSADFADTDGDGMNNWQEWRTGTIPTDPSSLLKMTTVANDVSGMTVTWQSVSGVIYFLQSSTDFTAQPAFSTIQTDITGLPGTTSYTDTDATGAGPYFYRVGVQ
jgi:hypothetical protein